VRQEQKEDYFYNRRNDQSSLIDTFRHQVFDDITNKIDSKFDKASKFVCSLNKKILEDNM
jgi:hypothetical protein